MAGRSRSQMYRARDRLYKNIRDPRIEIPSVETPQEIQEPVVEVSKCECLCMCATYASKCSGDCCVCGASDGAS